MWWCRLGESQVVVAYSLLCGEGGYVEAGVAVWRVGDWGALERDVRERWGCGVRRLALPRWRAEV